MADSVEVKLGASTSDATSAMDRSAASIADSLAKMSESLTKFGSTNKVTTDQAIRNNADLSRSFIELRGSITQGFNAIGGVIERVRGISTALVGILAGGALWHEAIASMTEFNHQVEMLENIMGMASDKATELAITLKLTGSNAEAYTGIALRMGRQLKQNEENFKTVGIATRDASGSLLPMQTIMQNAFERMQDFKAGTDQAEFALTFFGRNVQGVYEIMARYNSANERAKQLIHDLGVEWGPEHQAAVERYRLEAAAFSETLNIIAARIGAAVLPSLEGLATYFNERGPAAAQVFITAVRVVLTAIESLVSYGKILYESLSTIVSDTIVRATEVAKVAFYLQTAQWGKIPGVVADANAKVTANNAAAAKEITNTWASFGDRVGKIWTDIASKSGPGPGPLKSGSKDFPNLKSGGGTSVMTALNAELDLQKGHYEALKTEQGSFETWSLEMTRNYWAAALQLQGISSDDRISIEQKYWAAQRALNKEGFDAQIAALEEQKAAARFNMAERIAIAQQEAQMIAQKYGAGSKEAIDAEKKVTEAKQQEVAQRIRLEDVEQRSRMASAKASFEMGKLSADQQVALQQINATQRLAIERDYLRQEFDLEATALQDRIALMANDPNSDPVKLAEMKAQLLVIEQNYQKQLTQIDNAAVLEREKYALQANDAIRSSMSTLLSDLASGAKSFKQTLLDAANSLAQALSKIASDKLVQQFFGAGTSGGDFLSKITGSIFGGGATGDKTGSLALTTAGTTLTTAGTLLTTAAASLQTAAMALSLGGGGGIPGMGSLFGGGTGGDLFASLLGFADGSPYIEKSGLAMLHKGEAVIPANMNKAGMTGPVNVSNTFVLSGSVDTRTQAQIAMQQRRIVEHAMRRNA